MVDAVSPEIHLGKNKGKAGLYRFFKDGETPEKRPNQNQNKNLCPEYFLIENVQKYTVSGEIVIVISIKY